MSAPRTGHFDLNIPVTIGLAPYPESAARLADLVRTARADHRPRNFAERHLVDEMAINKWRLIRTLVMEKAAWIHEILRHFPESASPPDDPEAPPGPSANPHQDMFVIAGALAPERQGLLFAALARLEARFHRQFHNALRLFMAFRRLLPVSKEVTQATRKENKPCNPSPSPVSPRKMS